MKELKSGAAKRLINHLKAGTTPIDCVEYLNVGNVEWYRAAAELFDDIEHDKDSVVRFINGYYGDGKTHFLGMLRSLALNKNWVVSYVTSENTPLNKFHLVYSEITRNITLPTGIPVLQWISTSEPNGSFGLLLAFFSKIYIDLHGFKDKAGLDSMQVLQEIGKKVEEFTAMSGIDEMAGAALRGFIDAAMGMDLRRMREISSWLEGSNVRVPDLGLTRQINQTTARNIMRGISIIAKGSGIGGILVLLDEAERIMEQSKLVRQKSYGVMRDLLDNADNQGGMQSCVIYIAATPDMFMSEKGFAEYDALRSRLSSAQRFSIRDFIDWRGVIVDLTKTPLSYDFLVQIATRVRMVHAIARNLDSDKMITDEVIQSIVGEIEGGVFQVSRPRMVASSMATLLDIAEQNPQVEIKQVIPQILDLVQNTLTPRSETEKWE